MRFFENGPPIPNELLDARDRGDVVFICGAGISIPAGLPDFFRLTTQVADRLGIQVDSEIGATIEQERLRRAKGEPVSLFGSLAFDRMFTALVRKFGRDQVENEVVRALTPRKRILLDNHQAILDLARGPDGRCRLITTNFDRLFQKAQRRLTSYTPSDLPDLSRREGFDGVVHLHGRLPSKARVSTNKDLGLVLTSSDFGSAYLAEGWATRFICELLDRYIVVLLGYSADDPPVRYLLEGLNHSGRIGDSRLYALASGERTQVEAEWRDRGVTAIAYDPTDHHMRLWESITAWAQRARSPERWRGHILSMAATSPRTLMPYQRGQVAALCSSAEGATAFARTVPAPLAEWLCVFDPICRYWKPGRTFTYNDKRQPEIDPLLEYGLDDDPPRPVERDKPAPGVDLLAPLKSDELTAREQAIAGLQLHHSATLNRRLFQLSRWIISVIDSPTTAWWAATRGPLHPHLGDQIAWAIEREPQKLDPVIRTAWHVILEARKSFPVMSAGGWWTVQAQIKSEGWTTRTIREFELATRPHFSAERPWHYAPIPPEEKYDLKLSRIGQFKVAYPKLLEQTSDVPDSALIHVIASIRRNLEMAATLEDEISAIVGKLPTLYPEHRIGSHHNSEDDEYYLFFAELFVRLSKLDTAAARKEFSYWGQSPRFFLPLRIWALANANITSPAEVGRALTILDRSHFWDSSLSRELLFTIRARWKSLPFRARAAIERRLLSGRSKFVFENKKEYTERRARLSVQRLTWMMNAGLSLTKSTVSKLPALKKKDPLWRDEWSNEAAASNDSQVGWVKHDTATTPLAGLRSSKIIEHCDALAKREFGSFRDTDPFYGLVQTAPHRAMAALSYEARRGRRPARYWSKLLSAWPPRTSSTRGLMLARAITKLPRTLIVELRFEVTRWTSAHFSQLYQANRSIAFQTFDWIAAALAEEGATAFRSGIERQSIGGVEIASNRMGMDYAINSPTGDLAEALLKAFFAQARKRGEGLPCDYSERIEQLLLLPDEGGAHATTLIACRLHGLYAVDPKWTKRWLLPKFAPGAASAESAWAGLLASALLPEPSLLRQLKMSFLGAFVASPSWTADSLTHLGQFLILAVDSTLPHKGTISYVEARNALRVATPSVRLESLFFLRSRAKEPGSWKKLIVPFFTSVWPREIKYQSAETTQNLIIFLEDLDTRFPEAVSLVESFLVPTRSPDFFVFRAGGEHTGSHVDLAARYPEAVLTVLSKIVDEAAPHPPYGLEALLTKLTEAKPDVRYDERWKRLHRMISP